MPPGATPAPKLSTLDNEKAPHGKESRAVQCSLGNDRVRDPAVGRVIRPRALHGKRSGGEGDVLGTAGATNAIPRAFVGVFRAGAVSPAAGRVLVGDGLRVLVSHHDRHAVKVARGASVDIVLATAGTEIGHI